MSNLPQEEKQFSHIKRQKDSTKPKCCFQSSDLVTKVSEVVAKTKKRRRIDVQGPKVDIEEALDNGSSHPTILLATTKPSAEYFDWRTESMDLDADLTSPYVELYFAHADVAARYVYLRNFFSGLLK